MAIPYIHVFNISFYLLRILSKPLYALCNNLNIIEYDIITKPYYGDTLFVYVFSSFHVSIILLGIVMGFTVKFYAELYFRTVKVHYIWSYAMLSAESQSIYLFIFQHFP